MPISLRQRAPAAAQRASSALGPRLSPRSAIQDTSASRAAQLPNVWRSNRSNRNVPPPRLPRRSRFPFADC
eukprot:6310497-Prymnesium_polylepis.1